MLLGTFYIYRKMAKICPQIKITAIHGSSRVARNKEGCHQFFKFKLLPKLAKSSCGSTPFWLHHKIDPKNLG
jgi:hypothetical protein